MRRVPGRSLQAVARRLVAARDNDRIVEPAIADLQYEWSASEDAAFVARLTIRARAYLAALRVIAPRLLGAAFRASLEPPPWQLARRILVPSVVSLLMMGGAAFVGIAVGAAFIGHGSHPMRDHWLFYLPDRLGSSLAVLPLLWVDWFARGALGGRSALRPRANDVAWLTSGLVAFCVVWEGWLAPLIRQHYLTSLGLVDFRVAAVHQWTVDDLFSSLANPVGAPQSVATELHIRSLAPTLAAFSGVFAWMNVRATSLWTSGRCLGVKMAQLALVIALVPPFIRLEPARFPSRGTAIWLGIVAVVLGILVIVVRCLARLERRRKRDLGIELVTLLRQAASNGGHRA